MDQIGDALGWSAHVVLVLTTAAALQLMLQVLCVIDVWRRGEPRIVGRWFWTAAAVFGGMIGSLVYLAVGRGRPAAGAHASRSDGVTLLVGGPADTLYARIVPREGDGAGAPAV
jgi:hypothetical protein